MKVTLTTTTLLLGAGLWLASPAPARADHYPGRLITPGYITQAPSYLKFGGSSVPFVTPGSSLGYSFAPSYFNYGPQYNRVGASFSYYIPSASNYYAPSAGYYYTPSYYRPYRPTGYYDYYYRR